MKRLDYFKIKGIQFFKKMPKGWKKINNATTAPVGYVWINNNKSRFSKQEYQSALLKLED